jgi:hypothetical protein
MEQKQDNLVQLLNQHNCWVCDNKNLSTKEMTLFIDRVYDTQTLSLQRKFLFSLTHSLLQQYKKSGKCLKIHISNINQDTQGYYHWDSRRIEWFPQEDTLLVVTLGHELIHALDHVLDHVLDSGALTRPSIHPSVHPSIHLKSFAHVAACLSKWSTVSIKGETILHATQLVQVPSIYLTSEVQTQLAKNEIPDLIACGTVGMQQGLDVIEEILAECVAFAFEAILKNLQNEYLFPKDWRYWMKRREKECKLDAEQVHNAWFLIGMLTYPLIEECMSFGKELQTCLQVVKETWYDSRCPS